MPAVTLRGPLDLPASLERFRRWGDDLIDRWDGRFFLRGGVPPVSIEVVAPDRVVTEGPGAALVPAMIVQEPVGELAAADPVIAAADARYPGVRPILELDPLTAVIKSISAQQVNLRWACTTRRRLVERFGAPSMIAGNQVWSYDAEALARTDPMDIRALQFTTKKSEFIVAAARAAVEGVLDRGTLDVLDDDEIVARLTALPGVGRWTAEWFLTRTLGRPVVVAGDLGVRKAVGLAYLEGALPSEQDVRALTAHWGPAAGVAQQLLLHVLMRSDDP